MEEGAPQQPLTGPQQVDANQHQAESRGSQHSNPLVDHEHGGDHEGSTRTTHVDRSRSRGKGHASPIRSGGKLQRKINKLERELRYERRRRKAHNSGHSSEESDDTSYRRRSRTPSSESFSCEEEYHRGRRNKSPTHQGQGNDALNKALNQVSKSPFTRHIEDASLPRRFHQPVFTIYNGRTDPVEHLTQTFGARFITCRRVVQPLGSLLSMSMRERETLKVYSDRYWEMFNEVDGAHDDVAMNTFKEGLPTEHGLRKSLTGKPVTNVRQLMDRIDKYRRVEEDQMQGRGKSKAVTQEWRDFRPERYNNNRPRRDFEGQSGPANSQVVSAVFRGPVQRVLEKIKDESFFRWPNKMAGDPVKRNRNLYCQYHQDHGHITEDCKNLWDHLEQQVQEGKLTHLLYHSGGREGQAGSAFQGDASRGPPLATINVIFAAPGRTGSCPSRVMSVSQGSEEDSSSRPKKARPGTSLVLSFSEEDKRGTIQPHDDALVVTIRIGGYDVRRVMVDDGSVAEVMYPNLFRGLNLKPEDLTTYSSSLVGFEGKSVAPLGMVRLPVQTGSDMVEVDFIVVDAFSPYTAILGRPWLHALGTVSSTLHQKVKYPSGGEVSEILGNQTMAR
ncbi:uncharacterized protein LOC136064834 [Quercus suber]|uniref:uncharacterized protein LOC136064834 n=1 Tax=Quercus suber TaxID=58331 RepID=UPI0032E0313B